MGWEDEDFDYEEENAEEYPRDPAIDAAKAKIRGFFSNHRTTVFYVTQLQVIFEREFFHWITGKAVAELIVGGILNDDYTALTEDGKGRVRFVFHPSCRSTTRQIRRKVKLIRKFSTEPVGRSSGKYAEMLFSRDLMINGCKFIAKDASEHAGHKWEKSDHNLDYIFELDGRTYGCEIKNRFEYISRKEMETKAELCRFLGLTPLFIVRESPKNYINQINTDYDGFTLIYRTRIYSLGYEELVREIKNEFYGLPVDCPSDIPGSIVNRFIGWHRKRH
jgi:hypothetical protein